MVDRRRWRKRPLSDLTTAAVCILWLASIRWLIIGERYRTFLQPGFRYLLYAAAGVFVLFLLVAVLGNSGRERLRTRWTITVRGLVLLTPLLFMVAAEGTWLSSHALGMKQVRESGDPLSFLAGATRDRPAPNAEGELTIMDLVQHQDQLAGTRVMVRGGIFKDDRYPEDLRVLFRFAMLCCAADALPVGILVRPQEGAPAMVNDDWVRIEGILKKIPVNGAPHPVIEAARIEVLPPPPPGDRYLPLM
jgi:uncharacterized repeat protein (TIGR03943 family)